MIQINQDLDLLEEVNNDIDFNVLRNFQEVSNDIESGKLDCTIEKFKQILNSQKEVD